MSKVVCFFGSIFAGGFRNGARRGFLIALCWFGLQAQVAMAISYNQAVRALNRAEADLVSLQAKIERFDTCQALYTAARAQGVFHRPLSTEASQWLRLNRAAVNRECRYRTIKMTTQSRLSAAPKIGRKEARAARRSLLNQSHHLSQSINRRLRILSGRPPSADVERRTILFRALRARANQIADLVRAFSPHPGLFS